MSESARGHGEATHAAGSRLLDVENLRVEFQSEEGALTAVGGVSFHVDRGETVVLVGESGSGKSVTSLAIMRLIEDPPGRITSGTVRLTRRNGTNQDLAELDAESMCQIRGNEIAMIFQEPMTSLNPVYTIGDQIVEAITRHQGESGQAAVARAVEMLTLLGIPEPEHRMRSYPHQISGGMRQRVMIAMALSCNPSLLIADEPTTALDVTIQAQILDLIKRLQHGLGMAMIFITHNLGVAAEIADRVIVMYAGRIVEEGPVRAIFREPRMPYTIGLLNSVPRLGMDHSAENALVTVPGNVPSPRSLPPGCAFHPRCAYFEPGLCDREVPPLESTGKDGSVRCLRWREIADIRSTERRE